MNTVTPIQNTYADAFALQEEAMQLKPTIIATQAQYANDRSELRILCYKIKASKGYLALGYKNYLEWGKETLGLKKTQLYDLAANGQAQLEMLEELNRLQDVATWQNAVEVINKALQCSAISPEIIECKKAIVKAIS